MAKYLLEDGDIDLLFQHLKHGDQDHQDWLKAAIQSWFNHEPAPHVYGSGNKEKTY